MKHIENTIWIFFGALAAAYLTRLVGATVDYYWFTAALAFVYFAVVLMFGKKVLDKICGCRKQLLLKQQVLLIGVAVVLVFGGTEVFLPMRLVDSSITITAAGSKNEDAQGNEVRITQIRTNSTELNLTEIPLAQGWKVDEGVIICLPDAGAEPLTIDFVAKKNIEIQFLNHPWSGKVLVEEKNNTVELDLYAVEATDSVHTMTSNRVPSTAWDAMGAVILLYGVLFLAATRLSSFKKCVPLAVPIVFCVTIGNLSAFKTDKISYIILLILSIVLGCCFSQSYQRMKDKKYFSFGKCLVLALVSIYAALATIGRETLMEGFVGLHFSLPAICKLALCAGWYFVMVVTLLDGMDFVVNKRSKESKYTKWMKKSYKRISIVITVISCAVLSCTAVLIVDDYLLYTYQESSITVRATAEKGVLGVGNEVLISGISVDGVPQSYNELEVQHGLDWKPFGESGYIYNQSTNQSDFTIHFPTAKKVAVTFALYPVAGMVEVYDGDQLNKFDFSDANTGYSNHYYVYQVGSNRVPISQWQMLLRYATAFVVAMTACGFVVLLGIQYAKTQNTYNDAYFAHKLQFQVFFGICYLLLLFASASYYPGNWSWDNLYQWAQALGMTPISDGHPIVLTLYMRLLSMISLNPFVVQLGMSAVYALLLATVGYVLCLLGARSRFIAICLGVFCLLPSNFFQVTNTLKDIPHALLMMVIVAYLALILCQEKQFTGSLFNLLMLPVVLALIRLLRHDAILVYVCVFAIIAFIAIRHMNYKLLLSLLSTLLVVYFVNGYLTERLEVEKVSSVENSAALFLFKPLGYAIAAGEKEALDAETLDMMLSAKSEDWWRDNYEPYTSDTYSFGLSTEEREMLAFPKVMKGFLHTFFVRPDIIIRDKLDNADLIWNVFPLEGNGFFLGHDGIMTFFMHGPREFGYEPDENGMWKNDSELTKGVRAIREWSEKNVLTNIVLWRSGVYIVLLLILAVYCYNESRHLLWCFLPVIIRTLTLLPSMPAHHYRYIYYLPCTVFVLLLIILATDSTTTQTNTRKDI